MNLKIRVLAAVFFLNALAYAQLGKIIIEIGEFKNTTGLARITLFDQSKGFPSEYKFGIQSKSIKLDTTSISVVFDSLAYRQYAVSVLHDENENRKIDANIFGIPKEGYGVSNNINPKIGPPRFKEAAFLLNETEKKVKITIFYR